MKFNNTFQHGGVSMEEVIIPLAIMKGRLVVFISESTEQTQNLAKKLAKQINPGSIISLVGDLGTGKTTFTKGFAKQLGIKTL